MDTRAGVLALEQRQVDPMKHAYTCAADGTHGSIKHSDRRILYPTTMGWVCEFEGCGYTQTWSHVEHEHDLTCFSVCGDCEGAGCPEVTREGFVQHHCIGGIRWRYCHGGNHSTPHIGCLLR